MADPILTPALGTIFKSLAGLLVKQGVEQGKAYLKLTPVQKAIKTTSTEFPNVGAVEPALKKWIGSSSFAALLEAQTSGKKAVADEDMANDLVNSCGFITGLLSSYDAALRVLKKFLENLHDELYRSEDALVYAARSATNQHLEVIDVVQGGFQNIQKKLDALLFEKAGPPETVFQSIEKVREALENADSHYRIVATTKNEFLIEEKFPGAAKEKPFPISFSLEFDTNTAEGREALAAWKRHQETGEPLTLKSPFVSKVEIPEFISRALGLEFKPLEMTLLPVRDEAKLAVKIAIEADDGEKNFSETLYLEKIQGGTKQAILSNEYQGVPFILSQTVRPNSEEADTMLTFKSKGLNVKSALDGLRFFLSLSKGGNLRIESVETGQILAKARIPAGAYTGISSDLIEFLDALYTIQRKVSVIFPVPEKVSLQEENFIFSVAQIVETGKCTLTVKPLTLNSTPEQAKNLMSLINRGNNIGIHNYIDSYTVRVLGKAVFLGQLVTSGAFYITSDDLNQMKNELNSSPPPELLHVRLTPVEGSTQEARFIDWLPPQEADELERLPFVRQGALRALITLLFQTAKNENGEFAPEKFINLLDEARSQVSDDGRALNFLHSCDSQELYGYLKPLIESLSSELSTILTTLLKAKGWLASDLVQN